MQLTHLSLTNFRNYARLELDFAAGASLLVGDNAQGKSNLLEAVGYLATARSFRASAERELRTEAEARGLSPADLRREKTSRYDRWLAEQSADAGAAGNSSAEAQEPRRHAGGG